MLICNNVYKGQIHNNFLDFTSIENKITSSCKWNALCATIHSSFKAFIKCYIIQSTKILPQVFIFQNSAPRYLGANRKIFTPVLDQNLEDVAQKMRLPRPLEVQNWNGSSWLNFWATSSRFWENSHLFKMFKW